MKSLRYAAIPFIGIIVLTLTFALPLYAQTVATPYWCGSYSSLTPCTFGGYKEVQADPDPQYSYYTFPNEYYLNNYNFYFPARSSQYYYEG